LNAADEIAVEAFLQGKIGFLSIVEVVNETLARVPVCRPRTVEDILEVDRESRCQARELVKARADRGAVTA
jgi:1-deoxy-D-xylulose-5-phosphate reductoisomerase